MPIAPIGAVPLGTINPLLPIEGARPGGGITPAGEGGFSELFSNAVQNLNQTQNQAEVASAQVANGTTSDLHTALLTVEEANLTLQLTLQVRNKIVEAYQEVMRMQV